MLRFTRGRLGRRIRRLRRLLTAYRAIFVRLSPLTHDFKHAPHDVAYSHLPRLRGDQSAPDTPDALDEFVGIAYALLGHNTEEDVDGGDSAWSGITDLTPLEQGDEELDGGFYVVVLE